MKITKINDSESIEMALNVIAIVQARMGSSPDIIQLPLNILGNGLGKFLKKLRIGT